jgi:hypothetical protein
MEAKDLYPEDEALRQACWSFISAERCNDEGRLTEIWKGLKGPIHRFFANNKSVSAAQVRLYLANLVSKKYEDGAYFAFFGISSYVQFI